LERQRRHLVWAVVAAIMFGAGLCVGQRIQAQDFQQLQAAFVEESTARMRLENECVPKADVLAHVGPLVTALRQCSAMLSAGVAR
jgi:uncharacterized protein HemX